MAAKQRKTWPLFLIALPAGVAVWTGWVGLGALCGFGVIHPLPGIWDAARLNTAITLPIGVEAYGGYALGIWADVATPKRVRKFAFRSAIGSLLLGLLGQVAFHLLNAAGFTRAPWPVVVFVSCIPVAALGFGMGLHQLLIHTEADEAEADAEGAPAVAALSRVEVLDGLAGTITLAVPEPERWPDEPAQASEHEQVDDPPAPVHHEPPASGPAAVPSAPDEIDREAAELFGTGPSAPPVRPEPEPARPPAAKPAPSAKWTPAAAGVTEDEARQLARTLGRNELARHFKVGTSTASRIKREYGQPELASANGTR